jgi:hypothetical protein
MTDPRHEPTGSDPAADRLAREAGARLRASADTLDAATRARLGRARRQAVAALPGRQGPGRWLVPATMVAAAALVAVLVFRPEPVGMAPAPGVEAVADLELLASGEMVAGDLEMLEDLEFFAWLDEGRSPEELRAELDGVG